MMKTETRKRIPALILVSGLLAVFAGQRLTAEVYTLMPGGTAAQLSVAEILRSKAVLSEPVLINGSKGTLTVGATKLSPEEAAQFLKPKPGLTFLSSDPAALVVDEKTSGADLRRHFILRTGAKRETVVFSLRLPAEAAKSAAAFTAWPKELPAATGTPELVMQLDRTATSLATCQSPRPPPAAAAEYGEKMLQAGWKLLSSDPAAGTAEYLNPQTARLVLVRATAAPNGSQLAIFCSRTIDGK